MEDKEKKWTWETIADQLIEEFKHNLYAKDEKMPSENKMAVRFGVPRSEIRKAYEQLKKLGYVYSMQGYGSFFSGKRDKIRLLMNNESFSRKMSSLQLPVETQNISFEKLRNGSLIHSALNIDGDISVYKVVRLRILDGEPIAIHTSYLAESMFPHIAEDGPHINSIFDYIHSCGYTDLICDNTQLTVTSLNKKERALLHIKGYAPGLVLTARCHTQPSAEIVEIARTVYRSDKFIFEL